MWSAGFLPGWRSYTLPGGPKSPQVLGSGLFLTSPINSWYLNSHCLVPWECDCPHPHFSYLPYYKGEKQRSRREHTPTVCPIECPASACLSLGNMLPLLLTAGSYGSSLIQWFSASEPPGGLNKTLIAGPTPRASDSRRWGSVICISNQFPGDAYRLVCSTRRCRIFSPSRPVPEQSGGYWKRDPPVLKMEQRSCLQQCCQAWQECQSGAATLPP